MCNPRKCAPGGSDCLNFSALSASTTARVYKYLEHLTLNFVSFGLLRILTDCASFLRAVRRNSLMSRISFGCIRAGLVLFLQAFPDLSVLAWPPYVPKLEVQQDRTMQMHLVVCRWTSSKALLIAGITSGKAQMREHGAWREIRPRPAHQAHVHHVCAS
jgi:hypothetical protein